MVAFLFAYCSLSVVAYTVLLVEFRNQRRYRADVREHMRQVESVPLASRSTAAVTAPPLFTIDEGHAAQVVDDGASPLVAAPAGVAALDW